KIEADDLLKTSSDEVAGKYQQESNVIVAEQLGDSQGDEEMDEALRESEKNRRQLCENKDSFFNPDQDENISFYSTPDDVAPPQLPMDGPPKKENKTPETNIDDFSFYFPSQSPTGKPLAEESNVASDHTDGSLFYDIMTPELPVSPPPPQIYQPIVEFDNSFYLPEGVDSTVTVKDKQDDGFGDIFLPEKPKIETSLQTPDLLSSKNDGMAFDMGNDDLLSPELPDTPPPLNISQVSTNDEKSPFYTDTDLFNQKLPNIPSPVTETNEGDLVNLEWTPISPTEESPKMEFSTKKVLVREIDSTPEIIWPSDKNDKTLLTKATKSDSIVPETQPDVRMKELETTKETIQVFNTDDALESTIETIQVFNTDDVLESTKETIQVFNTDDVMESTKETIQVFNTDDVLESTKETIQVFNTDDVLESTKEPIQVFNTDDDDILDASYQVYKITAEERDLRECERVDNDENIDTKPIDKHALIEKWETTMSASNDPATEDREFVSRRSIKPSMPVNVYQDFGPVFRKKEAPKRCIVEVLTTTEEEDPEFKRERLRKNIIAEQRVLKTNQVHPPWIADKNDETHTDMKTLESIKQYEERKKKKERNKSDSSTSLNDTWDSGLGDTLKSEDIPVVEDIPRQNATLAVHSGIDDDHIDRFAIQQQWDKKLAMPESENIGSENDKKQKIQDDMHRDSGEDEGESICNTAKTRMQWEQRLSLKNEIPLPVYPHVTKYNAKQQRVERQLPPKDEDHDSASASESIEGSYEFTDSSEHAYVQEDDELDDKIEKHESIIEKEIRLQREKELEFQRELQAAHSGNKYEPYVAKQQDKAVSHGYSRSEPTILDDEEESVSSNDSEKSVSSENDEVVAEKSEFGKSVLEKELRAQREKEEELLHLGRVKTCSHALPEHDDIHKTSPISIESRIEREIRQEREREEILRKERGILTRSSEDEEPAYIVSSSKPEKTRPLWQPIKTTSEPKKQNFKPDQIPVSGKNEAKNIKGVNRQEAPSHYHNVLPSMEHGIDVLKEAHTVVVEQKTTFVEDQKSVPDPVNLEDSSLSDSDMEEPAAPPLNETIIQREIRLQKEREAAVQKQRERAGIAKKTNENKLEKKEKHTKDKKLDIQKINNLEVITIDKKDKKPASSFNNNNVDAKTRTAQARAVFTRPTIISVPEQNKSQPPVSKTTKIVSTKQDNDFEMPATQQNGPTNVKKETPIEKEIRLAKEKEEGLRKERGRMEYKFGMPPLAKHDSRQQIFTDRKKSVPTALSISFEESTDYNPPGSTAKDEYMKRAANYYLEKDMADHRKREEELKKEGKIKRLSTKCKDEDDDVNGDRHPKQIQNKTK
uniref:Intracellular protein transport protein USO1-like n=1 Tax=Saccoglossus kowalevskii TaxID=10224 RepID=A0ABM0MBF3_SACKO